MLLLLQLLLPALPVLHLLLREFNVCCVLLVIYLYIIEEMLHELLESLIKNQYSATSIIKVNVSLNIMYVLK